MSSPSGRHWARVFRVPVLLGLISAIGLLSALLGDDLWDVASWLALGVPCGVIAWYWFVRARWTRGSRGHPQRSS